MAVECMLVQEGVALLALASTVSFRDLKPTCVTAGRTLGSGGCMHNGQSRRWRNRIDGISRTRLT